MLDPSLTRRALLRNGLCGAALLAFPAGCGDAARGVGQPGSGRFLTRQEYDSVAALCSVVIPEDQDPGALSAHVADYIDFLLGAFTVDPPRIYAAGPYSGRHGGEDGFRVYLPLSRVKEIAWRTAIEGSRGLPEREFNGPVIGWQERYQAGIAELDRLARDRAGVGFSELPADEQAAVVNQADRSFINLAFEHTVEGMYAAPEYGGNADLVGWQTIDYEGDRQPIGYDRAAVEEADPSVAASPQGNAGLGAAAQVFEQARRAIEAARRSGGRAPARPGLFGGGVK